MKRGDRVVLVCESIRYTITQPLWTGKILKCDEDWANVIWDQCPQEKNGLDVESRHLVPEAVFNSPLYKALL